ncbi:hypothetical protein cyc_02697 [Cyclospora cayetanensis]|uniref:Uncharacterized protein n=1 Tax=Cyclospora cayetanensis TaxID=88456 RepID=A0A1D3CY59_9EIME|nr:hypothetical protein cyc_02697 [Cyclospora cayetanensis]
MGLCYTAQETAKAKEQQKEGPWKRAGGPLLPRKKTQRGSKGPRATPTHRCGFAARGEALKTCDKSLLQGDVSEVDGSFVRRPVPPMAISCSGLSYIHTRYASLVIFD